MNICVSLANPWNKYCNSYGLLCLSTCTASLSKSRCWLENDLNVCQNHGCVIVYSLFWLTNCLKVVAVIVASQPVKGLLHWVVPLSYYHHTANGSIPKIPSRCHWQQSPAVEHLPGVCLKVTWPCNSTCTGPTPGCKRRVGSGWVWWPTLTCRKQKWKY